nr:cell adhesion molecule Dscam2-like [Cherax quadricarinatus]
MLFLSLLQDNHATDWHSSFGNNFLRRSRETVLWSVGVRGRSSGPLLVLEPPSRTYLTNSTGVKLRCAALGSPTPTITWTGASGEAVQSQPGLREVLPDGSLWLPGVAGSGRVPRSMYRCKATNHIGTVISRATTLTTVVPSEVSVRAEASRVGVGGVGVVRCQVGGPVSGGWTVASWLLQETPSATPLPIPDAGRGGFSHYTKPFVSFGIDFLVQV